MHLRAIIFKEQQMNKTMKWIYSTLVNMWVIYAVWLILWTPNSDNVWVILYVLVLWYIDKRISYISPEESGDMQHVIGVLVLLWAGVIISLPIHHSFYSIVAVNLLAGIAYGTVVKGKK